VLHDATIKSLLVIVTAPRRTTLSVFDICHSRKAENYSEDCRELLRLRLQTLLPRALNSQFPFLCTFAITDDTPVPTSRKLWLVEHHTRQTDQPVLIWLVLVDRLLVLVQLVLLIQFLLAPLFLARPSPPTRPLIVWVRLTMLLRIVLSGVHPRWTLLARIPRRAHMRPALRRIPTGMIVWVVGRLSVPRSWRRWVEPWMRRWQSVPYRWTR
jgi:hypothetical protein